MEINNSNFDGWEVKKLTDVVYFQEGPGLRKYQFSENNEGIPFLNIRTFSEGHIDKTKCQKIKENEFRNKYEHFLLNDGDLVVSSSGSIGKVVTIRKQDLPVMLNTSVIRFRTLDETRLSQEYLKFYLQSDNFIRQLQDAKTGSAIFNYGPSHLKMMSIVVPPIDIQHKIASKLDFYNPKIKATTDILDRAENVIKQFRKSVLSAAVTGKLTEDWRNKYLSGQVNTVSTIDNFPFDLPKSWSLKTVEEIAEYIGGFAYKSTSFAKQGTNQVIRIGNVKPLDIHLDYAPVYVSEVEAKKTHKFILVKDDILLTMTGTKYKRDYGFACIVPDRSNLKLYINQRVACLRSKEVLPRYLLFYLQTDYFRNYFFENETGNVNQGNVGSTALKVIPIAVPTMQEQTEIVRRIDWMFEKLKDIQKQVETGDEKVSMIEQSILAKAFRGDL